jgi:hypothetical protein
MLFIKPWATCLLFCFSICIVKGSDPDPYLAAGIPATDRVWNGEDYVATLKVLTAGTVPLPRYSDPKGVAVLNRMFGQRDFSLYTDKTLPIQARLGESLPLSGAANGIGKLYYAQLVQGQDMHEEYANFAAFSLYIMAVQLDLLDEFIPTIPHDDKYPVRMAGLAQVKGGLTETTAGYLIVLADPKFFTVKDRVLVLQAFVDTMPKLKKMFTPAYVAEISLKFAALKKQFPDADTAALINQIEGQLANP